MPDGSKHLDAPRELITSLDLSLRQLAAGESVPLQPLLDELRADAAALEAEFGPGLDEPLNTPGF